MKRLEVKVCVCAQCIMNGAMDILESIESIQKLKGQLGLSAVIKVNANESLCDEHSKGEASPLVIVDGERMEKTTSEMVMSKIISSISKE